MKRLMILMMGLLVLSGCPREKRALDASRKAVEVAAQIVDIVNTEIADDFTAAAEVALAECETRPCYDARMAKWTKVAKAFREMKNSLLIVEAALDTWEAGSPNGRDNLIQAAGCFIETLVALDGLLESVDARTTTLTNGISYAQALFGATSQSCRPASP